MAFIKDLIIKKRFINYNVNIINIKTSFFIKIIKLNNYKRAKLYSY